MDNINNFIKNLEALAVEVAKPNYIAGSIFTGLKAPQMKHWLSWY